MLLLYVYHELNVVERFFDLESPVTTTLKTYSILPEGDLLLL